MRFGANSLLRCKLALPTLKMPPVAGKAIRVDFRPHLAALRGQLISDDSHGSPVHAGSFLRQRRITLDSALLRNRRELRRILIHEVFHFVWSRLGNPKRGAWEAHLRSEMAAGVRGELGWSAALRKEKLGPEDWRLRTRRWRDYLCESFCDTAAWRYSDSKQHDEFTLGFAARNRRAKVFDQMMLIPVSRNGLTV